MVTTLPASLFGVVASSSGAEKQLNSQLFTTFPMEKAQIETGMHVCLTPEQLHGRNISCSTGSFT